MNTVKSPSLRVVTSSSVAQSNTAESDLLPQVEHIVTGRDLATDQLFRVVVMADDPWHASDLIKVMPGTDFEALPRVSLPTDDILGSRANLNVKIDRAPLPAAAQMSIEGLDGEAPPSEVDPADILFTSSRYAPRGKGYELSSQGDKRFSALNARLGDGRTIEEAYQLDVKGYRAQGNDWRLGKGQPAVDGKSHDALWVEYLALWRHWAAQNPALIEDLRGKAAGLILTDKFASSPISQARALAQILNESEAPCVDVKASKSLRP